MSGSKNKILFLHKSLMLSFVKGHLKSVVFGLSVTTWKGLASNHLFYVFNCCFLKSGYTEIREGNELFFI